MRMKQFKRNLAEITQETKALYEFLDTSARKENSSNVSIDIARDDVGNAFNELNTKAFDVERKQRKLLK